MHKLALLAKLLEILLLVATAYIHAQPVQGTPIHKNCQMVTDETGDDWSILIRRSGTFCLGRTLKQSWPLIRLPHQAVPMSPLISVAANHVSIDLMNYQLSARTPIGQGVLVEKTLSTPLHSIEISRGTITTSNQPAIFMVHAWNYANKRFGRGHAIALSNGDLEQYRPTEFILDGLTLEAENHTIIMQGMRNIIRHCKIIGGNGTVNVFGPQLIFEDNEIILHANAQTGASGDAPIALYLEDAADSIVRNNRIVIKGQVLGSEAIVLKNSPNVTLSGNVITGADTVYKLLDENSSVTATSNILNGEKR